MCINPIKINGKQFPCGKCVECSKAYQNSLAIRCTEEAKDWKHTYMITLTYDDEHLPTKRVNPFMVRYCDEGEVKTTYFSSLEAAKSFVKRHDIILDAPIINVFKEVSSYLNEINNPKANAPYQSQELLSGKRAIKFPTQRKGDFQRFMKSLRKSLEREGRGERVKYLFSSEYGDNTWRPHYHAILFTNLPFEIVKPLVDHYWTMGFIECHEVSEVYKGTHVDKQAAFMYASKYIVKPEFLQNPLEKMGIIDPCFRAWSKGLGKTYRKLFKSKADKIIERISDVASDTNSISFYNPDCSKVRSFEINEHFDLTTLFNKQIHSINGVSVDMLDELVKCCCYTTLFKQKVLNFSLPRYFKDSIKPKIKVKREEIDYETGEVYEKILERIDCGAGWYNAFKNYVELCHIQQVYRDLCTTGKITSEDTYGTSLFKVREALSVVDDERIRESYKKAYKSHTIRG